MSSSEPPPPVQSPPGSSIFSPQFRGHAGLNNGYVGFSSSRPKSPKSAKGTILENPLLKSSHQFAPSFGGTVTRSDAPMASSFLQQQQQQIRSPLSTLGLNVGGHHAPFQDNAATTRQGFASPKSIMKKLTVATPGPPPKASLSLMGGVILPTEMKAATPPPKEPELTHQLTVKASAEKPNDSFLTSPPPLLDESRKKTRASSGPSSSSFGIAFPPSEDDRWVVAYGYTSLSEYNQLLDILSSFGTLQQHQSSGNWLAVQYESQLSAERALCCQPVSLGSNTLCGTVRGTPALLQRLGTGTNQSSNRGTGTTAAMIQRPIPRLSAAATTSGRIPAVDDYLLLTDGDKRADDRPRPPTSICQKAMCWYFGWESIRYADDDDEQPDHPHSD